MANERQWVLWELHRGQASLEQLFRELTADAGEGEEQSVELSEAPADVETGAMPRASEEDAEVDS